MTYDPSAGAGGGSWEQISTIVLANQATAEFDLTGTFKMYRFQLTDVVPISDNTELRLKMSTNGGSTFLEAAAQYVNAQIGHTTGGTLEASASSTYVLLSSTNSNGTMGTGTTESLSGLVNVHNARQATNSTLISSDIVMFGSSGTMTGMQSYGMLRINIAAVDAIRFYAETGNLSTGKITLYGLKLS